MSATDFSALLPLIAISLTGLAILVMLAVTRSHASAFGLTIVGLGSALVLTPLNSAAPRNVTELLVIDPFGSYFTALLLAAALLVTLLLWQSRSRGGGRPEEAYLLLLTATLGAAVLVSCRHFATFILGLELLTISLYGLIGYDRDRPERLEAGVKYLILGAVSSAFLLFGLALIYAQLGTMVLPQVVELLRSGFAGDPIVLTGIAMLAVGIGFKMALVPFHMWTPDVYQGSSAAVTAFIATVSKGGVFAFLLRYFIPASPDVQAPLFLLFSIIAAASMIAGNLLALLQSSVRRILAYSSIAHLGYLLVAFLAGGTFGRTASSFYLAAYFTSILAAFGTISVLSSRERRVDRIEDFRGLYWTRPALALVLTASLFSLAGIPLTAGFLGKFYLAAAGVGQSLYWLVLVLVVTSGIGLFYYLRIIVAMASEAGDAAGLPQPRKTGPTGVVALASLLVVLLWLGLFPETLISLIRITSGV